MTDEAGRPELHPAESMALTVALGQWHRGAPVTPNVATMCVLALARITGRYDYLDDPETRALADLAAVTAEDASRAMGIGPDEMFGRG